MHMKDDPRTERSAELLYQGLLDALKEKDFDRITVSDISKRSTVGRSTFYRNFDEIADLLGWKCDRQFKEVLSGFCETNPPLKQDGEFILYVLRYWMDPKNLEVLEIIFRIHRVDLVYAAFTNYGPILVSYMKKRGLNLQDADSRYVIAIRAGYFLGMMAAWIEGGKKRRRKKRRLMSFASISIRFMRE